MTDDHSITLDALRAELDRERARADSVEALSRVQAASLAELAKLGGNLRCQVADLLDDALSSKPMPVHGLRNVTGRMDGLAETVSRAARGYAGARTTDMLYPTVDDDLRAHQWMPRPDRGLDGVLPPIPITEMGDRRGYARGWHRGPQWITLWFTGPCALAYADSSDHGRLTSVDAVRAVITSVRSLSASALAEWVAARQEAHTVPFDASYVRVFEHLRAGPWSAIDIDRCDEFGVRTPGGTGNTSVWACPSDPDFRVYVWGIGHEPAHVRYWAGTGGRHGPPGSDHRSVPLTGDRRRSPANPPPRTRSQDGCRLLVSRHPSWPPGELITSEGDAFRCPTPCTPTPPPS